MKKLFLIIFSFFITSPSMALYSVTELFSIGSGFKYVYKIDADYSYSSDAITGRLAKEYFRKGFINNSMKDEVSKNLSTINKFSGEFNSSITIGQNLDTIFGLLKGSSFIRLSNRSFIHSNFTKDLFELYFRGNKNYADKVAELGPFQLKSYTYQQFSYGIERHHQKNKKSYFWSAAFSVNIGQKYSSYDSPASTLYTASDGSYLDVDLDLLIRTSDSAQSSLGSFNGYGFSGSGMLVIKDEDQNAWAFSADNFGYIRWTKESAQIPVDSVFRFEGIDATDIFDFSDTIRKEITSDSAYIQSFVTDRRKKAFNDMLPLHLSASYSAQVMPGKLVLMIGAEQILFSGAGLRGYSRLKYNFKRKHQLALTASYGGYTFWNLGIAYNAQLGRSWVFGTGTDYLSAMLNSRKGLASGAFVTLEKYF
ncbi:MAG TPA: DUF5723 family protein [Bacteroidia bacterium]|nr:DUF5723 family protein [Bacteroidia bacterium]HNS12602.1 DUF5723 family protein [Bacteroidia bacterium]